MKHRTPQSHEACFPFSASLTAFPERERKRFLAFARNDNAGKTFCYREGGFSLLPLEGGALKGQRLDGDSGISETKPSPRGEGGERSEPDRVLAV